MENCREVCTPSIAPDKTELNMEDYPLDPSLSAKYRRAAALCNYLSQDRCDIGYATKEVARWMSKPRMVDELHLKRLIRYLRHHPRGVYKYSWQQPMGKLQCFTDSDWAGCVHTRKSTSGGALMRGGHCLHHWSRTQATIALSSGEAELNSSLKGGTELIGARTLM